jgi:hypothetical protein
LPPIKCDLGFILLKSNRYGFICFIQSTKLQIEKCSKNYNTLAKNHLYEEMREWTTVLNTQIVEWDATILLRNFCVEKKTFFRLLRDWLHNLLNILQYQTTSYIFHVMIYECCLFSIDYSCFSKSDFYSIMCKLNYLDFKLFC